MPTIYQEKGYRFFFYAGDREEPAHVHVEKGEKDGKVWLEPEVKIKYLNDFKAQERKEIMRIVEENVELLKASVAQQDGMSSFSNDYDNIEKLIYE